MLLLLSACALPIPEDTGTPTTPCGHLSGISSDASAWTYEGPEGTRTDEVVSIDYATDLVELRSTTPDGVAESTWDCTNADLALTATRFTPTGATSPSTWTLYDSPMTVLKSHTVLDQTWSGRVRATVYTADGETVVAEDGSWVVSEESRASYVGYDWDLFRVDQTLGDTTTTTWWAEVGGPFLVDDWTITSYTP